MGRVTCPNSQLSVRVRGNLWCLIPHPPRSCFSRKPLEKSKWVSLLPVPLHSKPSQILLDLILDGTNVVM